MTDPTPPPEPAMPAGDLPQAPPPPPPAGYPAPPPMPYAAQTPPPASPRNGMGIAALILAIIALLICWIPFVGFLGLLLGVVAVILGVIGRGRAKRGEATNGGVALGGLVLGVFAVLGAIASAAIWFFIFKEVGGSNFVDCMNNAGQDQSAQQQCSDQFRQHLETKFSVTITTGPLSEPTP
jgi:hypothetical protein